ncbi:SURF1 family protein [Dongia sp.]|uniref:SURF1 family protein n=1 Tax=Dongia sp. TaxID=1977262 RepID=UPI0035B401BB
MNARAFRPGLWPTLFTVPAVLFMLALCVWQVQRLYWKEGLIAARVERTTAAPVALPPVGSDLAEVEFRRVALDGRFDHAHEFYMPARSQNGNVGYWIVTPFLPADGTQALLVNRGWVPEEKRDAAARPGGQFANAVAFDGIVRLPQVQGWFQPDNEPAKNRWFYLAPAEMAAASGLAFRDDLYLDAVKTEIPGNYPLGGQTRIQMPNDHLQYAITWGALALALAVIYAIHGFKTGSQRAE